MRDSVPYQSDHTDAVEAEEGLGWLWASPLLIGGEQSAAFHTPSQTNEHKYTDANRIVLGRHAKSVVLCCQGTKTNLIVSLKRAIVMALCV